MTRRIAVGASSAALGLLILYRSLIGIYAIAVAAFGPMGLYAISVLPIDVWALGLIVACQVTGARFSVGGFHFLPEHIVLLGFGGALVLASPRSVFRRPLAFEAALLAWIAWNAVTTMAFSVDRHSSLAIVGWMTLAWAILWVVRGYFRSCPDAAVRVIRTATTIAAALGAVTFCFWVAALAGLPSVRMQPEFVTATIAAKGPALEANLLGSQSLCWLFLLLRARVLRNAPLSPWLVAGLVLGIVSTMTRAVWISTILVVAGCLVIDRLPKHRALGIPSRGRSHVLRNLVVATSVAVVLVTATGGVAGRKLESAFDFGSSTGGARLTNWRLALDDLVSPRAFVTGLGTNSYGQRHLSRTLAGQPDYLGNLPLSLLYDTGIVGVVLFGGAMTLVVLRGRGAIGRLLNLMFVAALMIVGAATNPIWFGFVWVTVAVLDSDRDRRSVEPPPSDVQGLPARAYSTS